MRKRFGILVGGGPAPGINSVIGAATIRACLSGYQVVGIQDGYKWLLAGDTSRVVPLQISDTGRIHFRGGSHLGISRDGPGTDIAKVDRILTSLEALDVDKLVVIGGDGTGTAAAALHARADGRIRVVHVPKTIDNDLDLPEEAPTFGYQTARHHGVELVRSLMVEAKTTSRWFFAVTMGRKAGHLALGIGKSVGATLTLIPEEFAGVHVTTNLLADTLAAAVLKRRASGRNDGIAVLAEGLVTLLAPAELASLGPVSRDAYGRVHLGEIPYGDILKQRVTERLGTLGIRTQIVAKNFGYELRCVDPVPFDMELTRDLGYGAAKLLTEGGGGVTIALARGRLLPIPFDKMCDTETGRMRLRLVDVTSDRYKIARTYMIRLRAEDLEDPAELGKLASTAGLTPEEFVQELGHVVRAEGHFSLPPPSVTWRTLRGKGDDDASRVDSPSPRVADAQRRNEIRVEHLVPIVVVVTIPDTHRLVSGLRALDVVQRAHARSDVQPLVHLPHPAELQPRRERAQVPVVAGRVVGDALLLHMDHRLHVEPLVGATADEVARVEPDDVVHPHRESLRRPAEARIGQERRVAEAGTKRAPDGAAGERRPLPHGEQDPDVELRVGAETIGLRELGCRGSGRCRRRGRWGCDRLLCACTAGRERQGDADGERGDVASGSEEARARLVHARNLSARAPPDTGRARQLRVRSRQPWRSPW